MKFLDPQHPFYRPLWIRVAVVTACLAWTVFELVNGTFVWAAIFAGVAAYCAYNFFVIYDRNPSDDGEK